MIKTLSPSATGLWVTMAAMVISTCITVPAYSSWLTDFTAEYGSAPHSCNTCHTSSGFNPRNDYGTALEGAAGATPTEKMQAVEGDDSDGDGVSNIDEINAGANPGISDGTPAPTAAYLGSDACAGCHASTYAGWKSTLHSSMYRSGDELVGSNILSVWSGVASVEDTSRGLGPIYVTLGDSGDPDNGPYVVSIYKDAALSELIAGPLDIVRFHGGRIIPENANNDPRGEAGSSRGIRRSGEHYPGEGPVLGKQRYQVEFAGQHFILPIQWNPISDMDGENQGWVEYHLRDWIDTDFNLKLAPTNSEERRCAGCHQTGITEVTFNADTTGTIPGNAHTIDGAFELVGSPGVGVEENIGCEACHGPASEHPSAAFSNPTGERNIILPTTLTKEERVDACGHCHSRGSSIGTVNGSTLGYPYRDDAPHRPLPGDTWSDFYNEGGGYWIDTPELRVAKQHHQQYEEFVLSDHFLNPYVEMTCSTCHDNHGTSNEHDIVTTIQSSNSPTGEAVVTGARGTGPGSLCAECHMGHGPIQGFDEVSMERHYWHPPDGTHGSPDCTNCHMPATAKSGVSNDIHSHAFGMLGPENIADYQAPVSCMAMCHNSYGLPASNPSFKDWDDPEDLVIAEWLEEHIPGSELVAKYLAGDSVVAELVSEHAYMLPALDTNDDTEAINGTDTEPFVIDAADVVTYVNDDR